MCQSEHALASLPSTQELGWDSIYNGAESGKADTFYFVFDNNAKKLPNLESPLNEGMTCSKKLWLTCSPTVAKEARCHEQASCLDNLVTGKTTCVCNSKAGW